jgi:hypothetical protein
MTHKLVYNRKADRWQCACGYALGDGRKQFLARCKLSLSGIQISSETHEKPKKKTAQREPKASGGKRRISKAASDLFEL